MKEIAAYNESLQPTLSALKMTKFFIFLALVFAWVNSIAGTISKNQIIGSWVDHKGYGVVSKINTYLADTNNRLVVNSDFSAIFTRTFGDGTSQVMKSKPEDTEFYEDLFIFKFTNKIGVKVKLVLGGWANENSKLIFGYMYLYNQDGLFNGMQLSLIQQNGT